VKKKKDEIKKQRNEYREENRDKLNKESKEYYQKNKDKINPIRNSRNREKRKNDPLWRERKKKVRDEYKKKNRDKINATQNEYHKEKKKNDPLFKLLCNARTRLWNALKSQNASKNKRTLEYINCSVAHLYYHIEQQFTDGMYWKNHGHGKGKWNVDHRRPCDSFDLNDEEQMYMCFHWTNLQPMWAQENLEKSNHYDPETFQYKWIDREIGWVGIPSYLMNK